jgi:alpha-maltose-1-phosphate synthase
MGTTLVGIVGSGLIGRDPFDRRCWSGSSYFFFTALAAQGALHRAFGVEAPRARRWLLMAGNFRRDRAAWRARFYSDPRYRDALTAEVRRRLRPDDLGHDFLQLGAMYDVPRLLDGRARCFSYHDGNLAEKLRSPNAPVGLGARRIDRALAYERRVYHGIDKILTMSEYLRRSFIRDFDVPEDRVVAVGAGINLDEVPGELAEKRYDGREVLFIGVDFARKGGWELLKAFQRVRGRYPDARLHIVGPRELAIPPDLEGGVSFHGFLNKSNPADRARLDELFGRCCLFVMPSLYEPFGIAPLEAMVHQLPCLVTNRWALAETVTPGETGDLVECGDVDDLAAKLGALLADPDALRQMGDAGRRMVLERYTWDRVARRVVAEVSNN